MRGGDTCTHSAHVLWVWRRRAVPPYLPPMGIFRDGVRRVVVQQRDHASSHTAQVVVNFGHELMTSVHMPIKWSDRRPSESEFRASFATTRLSARRLLSFVGRRAGCIRSLALQGSDGFWCGEPPRAALYPPCDRLQWGVGKMPRLVCVTVT